MTSRSSSCATSPEIGDFISATTQSARKIHLPTALVGAAAQIADVAVLTLVGVVVESLSRSGIALGQGSLDLLLASVPGCVASLLIYRLGGYSVLGLCARQAQVRGAILPLLAGAACFAAGLALRHRPGVECADLSLGWLAMSFVLLAGERAVAAKLISGWCADGRIARRVAIIGTPAETQAVVARLAGSVLPSARIVGVFSDRCGDEPGLADADSWPRSVMHLLAERHRSAIDAIIIALPDAAADRVPVICAALRGLVADIYVTAAAHIAACGTVERVGDLPVGLVVGRPLSDWQQLQKTVFDRIGAFCLLVAISPVLLLIAIAVRLDSPGPALFRQQRTGFNNLPFTCLKFRTMRQQATVSDVLQQTVRGDRRVTRVGGFLRRTSLDELPQLLNVLRGDMSLVGPRPHAPNTTAGGKLFRDIVADYPLRYRVKPGITGWAQVHGYRGETPTAESIERRVEYDLFYVQNWSLMLDIRILVRTLMCVLHDPQAF